MPEKEQPNFPTGEYPELSPNPKTEDKKVDGEHGTVSQENQRPKVKPTVIPGDLIVKGNILYLIGN